MGFISPVYDGLLASDAEFDNRGNIKQTREGTNPTEKVFARGDVKEEAKV